MRIRKYLNENTEYEIKPNLDVSSGDFWYDLAYGGYIKPEKILAKAHDVLEVKKAIAIIIKFEQSCKNQIEEFEQ